MPEQASRRGSPVVNADLTAPVSTPIYPFGNGGLDLTSAIDQVKVGDFTRLSNLTYTPGGAGGELSGRPGQTVLASVGTTHHSVVRLDDPLTADYTRIWGVDTSVYRGVTGALTVVDGGYSGHPLTLLPHRPPLSGEPWVFVGDAYRNRKVRGDGLALPIGLPAPGVAAAAALGPAAQTDIADFDLDGTGGGVWTPNAGQDFSTPPLTPDTPTSGVHPITLPRTIFITNQGTAVNDAGQGYYQFWGLARALDLSLVGGLPASDDDLIHLNIQFGNPTLTAEFRLYFVVSATFSTSVLPGTPADGDPIPNSDYYVKAFRPGDFSQFVLGVQAQVDASETSRINYIREQTLLQSNPVHHREGRTAIPLGGNADTTLTPTERSSLSAVQVGASAGQVEELGIIGQPLRRSDFERYGNTEGRDWSTVTGIILYLQAVPGTYLNAASVPAKIDVSLGQCYLSGGYGPDSADAAAQKYDWRYTFYDPRTGAEGNPSPVMADAALLDAARQQVLVTPTASGDTALRQRIYRRGGTLTDDWHYEGVNDSDGGVFTDILSDLALVLADTVDLNHYQAVPTVDGDGTTILAQPVTTFFGPVNGQLFALGDPYRPGFVYACIPGEPDHWPPELAHEVCAPSEALQNGVLYGGQPFVFSKLRGYTLYPNISGDAGMTSAPSGCTRGLAGRWALTIGAGAMWFVANDGVCRTTGGTEEVVSTLIAPLFQGLSRNGYFPIDFSVEAALRLAVYRNELYFQYQDTDGSRQVMVLQILTGQWRHYRFGQQNAGLYAEGQDTAAQLIIGGVASGTSYLHGGFSDDGGAINALVRTAAWDFGQARAEKLLADQFLDADRSGVTLYLTNLINNGAIVNPTEILSEGTGRARAIFDAFGLAPQHARNVMTEITWAAALTAPPPTLYQLGISHALQPDLTINRMTQWDDLEHPDEKYVTGITLDVDTGNVARTIHIEGDVDGTTIDLAVLTVQSDGRHKFAFSWPGQRAHKVRIRPDDDCKAWLLYRADWIYTPEPPRIAGWDVYFENAWDQYYTGVDLYCDTEGADKIIEVFVDEILIGTYTVNTLGRKVWHITLPWGRGHVFRFVAVDGNPGTLYSHRWHLAEEPSEQTNWNQPFTIAGTQADKWVKAVIFEMDSFGLDKLVDVEIDGVVVETLTVNTVGRLVQQVALTEQQRGRVLRFFPRDANPSRLYSIRIAFDEEPFKLKRWESQWIDHDLGAFHSILEAQVTLESSADVTLDMHTMLNQVGTTTVDTYVIPSTDDAKQMRFVPFNPRNGVLYKYVFTSAQPFFLYTEESHVLMQPFGGGEAVLRRPWGNAANDRTRVMTNATIAAEMSGGGT